MNEVAFKENLSQVKYFDLPLEQKRSEIYAGKRLIDLLLGIIGATVFMILFPVFALGIKLSSKGPIIFKQARKGYLGEIFYCYKFRTMHIEDLNTENKIPAIAKHAEDRIFKFGRFLRKTNLDEFPQMINVLKGEMSLVGPRPYPVDECEYWNDIFDDHFSRYTVIPGLTGYAQVKGYRGGTLDSELMRKRLNYDLAYTQNPTMLFDIKIICKTIFQMIPRIKLDSDI